MSQIACIQTSSGPDPDANWTQVQALIRQAHAQGAELVALPEVVDFNDDRSESFQRYARPVAEHVAIQRFAALAAELRVWILAGSMTVRAGNGKLANRTLVFDAAGSIVAQYDKIHLFDTGMVGDKASKESNIFEAGDRAVVLDTPIGRVGLSICYDLRFPHLFRDLAKAGERTGVQIAQPLLRLRFIVDDHGVAVMACRNFVDEFPRQRGRADDQRPLGAGMLAHEQRGDDRQQENSGCRDHGNL